MSCYDEMPPEIRAKFDAWVGSLTFQGLPMPCAVDFHFPDGRVEELRGVVVRDGETFSTAVEREARERGARVRFRMPRP